MKSDYWPLSAEIQYIVLPMACAHVFSRFVSLSEKSGICCCSLFEPECIFLFYCTWQKSISVWNRVSSIFISGQNIILLIAVISNWPDSQHDEIETKCSTTTCIFTILYREAIHVIHVCLWILHITKIDFLRSSWHSLTILVCKHVISYTVCFHLCLN